LRLIFALIFAALLFFGLRYKVRQYYRRIRGLPEPEQEGPKTTTIILIAIAIIYGALLSYRIFIGGTLMH